jgi:hypothetical protein
VCARHVTTTQTQTHTHTRCAAHTHTHALARTRTLARARTHTHTQTHTHTHTLARTHDHTVAQTNTPTCTDTTKLTTHRSSQAGKVHFGYIYGFGITGAFGMYTLVNLMSDAHPADLVRVFSVLGYSLLPIVALAGVAVVIDLRCVCVCVCVCVCLCVQLCMHATTSCARLCVNVRVCSLWWGCVVGYTRVCARVPLYLHSVRVHRVDLCMFACTMCFLNGSAFVFACGCVPRLRACKCSLA